MKLEEYRRMFEAEDRQWWYAGMRAISFALLDPALQKASAGRPRVFLDAGCGSGGILAHLEKRGRAVGVDLSLEALGLGRARGVAAACASLMKLPFADASFDGVTSFDVLYHRWVEDDGAAVAELVRVLRPGGLLLVRVPALKALWGAHDEAVYSRHRYTRRELETLLHRQGLEVMRTTYCNSFLLPLLVVRRTLDRLTGRHGSDVQFLPAPLEALFRRLLLTEAWLVGFASLPLGASVMTLARKPA